MKLLSWNVQWFRGLDGVVDVGRVLAHARALCDFDVLCLQEVSACMRGLPGGDFDQVAEVERLLPGYSVFFAAAVDLGKQRGGPRERFGNLLATRLPTLLVEHHPLPLLREAGTPSSRRICTHALLQTGSGPVSVFNTHLEFHSPAQRALQVQRLLEIIRENADLVTPGAEPDEPADGPYRVLRRTQHSVLCGDLNFGPGSSEYRSLLRGNATLALRDLFSAWSGLEQRQPTFGCFDRSYVSEPIACDHVLATPALASRPGRIAVDTDCRLSDHQPVWAEWESF
jgi:endonuclease/exonuclease/phosphatase family metal-dependent hydrolase